MVNFDDVLKRYLGEFGCYQKRVYFLLALLTIPCSFRMMDNVYILNVPDHRCAIPGYGNDTYTVQSAHHARLINDTIPYVERDGEVQYSACYLYSPTSSTGKENVALVACDKWVYDKAVFKSTVATEMDMVCSRSLEAPNAQVIFMGGYLVGATLFGAIGDKFGRRASLMSSLTCLGIGSIAINWAPTYVVFVVIRFVVGAATAGVYSAGYVIGMEFIGPSKRVWAGLVVGFVYTSGYSVLTGIAYFIRDWHTLQLVTSVPVTVFFIYWWLIPESPRWLLNQGRVQEAEVIIQHAAKVNKVKVPSILTLEKEHTYPVKTLPRASLLQLFTSRLLLLRTIAILFTWIVICLVYFGLSANTDNLGAGSLHLNTFLSSLVEYPAGILCLLLLDRIGRKKLLCAFMIIGGSACISTVLTILYADVAHQWITVALSMAGKLCISGAFGVIYIYSSEVFPTVVRSSAIGLSSSMGRVGGMVAPYFLDWGHELGGHFGRSFPMMLFGIMSVSAGLLDLTLPETINRDLPETIEDAKRIDNRKRKSSTRDGESIHDESQPLI